MARPRLGVIGVGHLGKEHARILSGLADVELAGVSDVNVDQARTVAERCNTRAFANYQQLLPQIDAAVVVVPTTYHHAIAGDCLRHGIHLLVEKPLTTTLDQANDLVSLAKQHRVILQVGHIERFNPAFEELQRRRMQPKFVTCERFGPFSGRSADIGVVLDLMIHDLDLLLAFVQSEVLSAEALGVSVLGAHEDVANARLVFANGCVAHVNSSRVSQTAKRQMQVWSPEGFASVDFAKRQLSLIQPTESLRRHGHEACTMSPAQAMAMKHDLFTNHLQTLELDRSGGDQLTRELQDFVHCVQSGERPRVSGEDGRDVIALATRILDSLRSHRWDDAHFGPNDLPAPRGPLFTPFENRAAA